VTRWRHPLSKRWRWPDDEDIRAFALVAVLVFTIINTVTQCTMGPVTGGEPDLYEQGRRGTANPTEQTTIQAG
jgi:hypothetical protein